MSILSSTLTLLESTTWVFDGPMCTAAVPTLPVIVRLIGWMPLLKSIK